MDEASGLRLIITMTATGQLNIEGIPDNKLICYGMLRMAEMLITDYYQKQAANRIQPAAVMPFIKPS